MSVPPLASYHRSGERFWPTVTRSQSLPVAVVRGQWVGDMPSGHQEESTPNMPGTEDGKEDEGGLEADTLFMKELQKKEGKVSITPISVEYYSQHPKGQSKPLAEK